jgi:type I restriction enzyme M protein
MVDRVRKEFSAPDIDKIAGAYHRWRAKPETRQANGWADYADEAGFCKSATVAEVNEHGHVLTPGRYVGAADIEDDGVSFAEKFEGLREQLQEQFAESRALEGRIMHVLDGVKYYG